jgi:hypothetical protein
MAKKKVLDWESEVDNFINDDGFAPRLSKILKCDEALVRKGMYDFVNWLDLMTDYKTSKELRIHFWYWFPKNIDRLNRN